MEGTPSYFATLCHAALRQVLMGEVTVEQSVTLTDLMTNRPETSPNTCSGENLT